MFAPSNRFEGACLDSFVRHSVMELRKAKLYTILAYMNIKLSKSKGAFRFKIVSYECSGKIFINIPTNYTFFALVQVKVGSVDKPFLLGFDLIKFQNGH